MIKYIICSKNISEVNLLEANVMRNLSNSTGLLIDDEDKGQEESGTSIPETGSLLLLGKNEFKGCVSNLYTRR